MLAVTKIKSLIEMISIEIVFHMRVMMNAPDTLHEMDATEKRRNTRIIRIAALFALSGFIVLTAARIVMGDFKFVPELSTGTLLTGLTIWINHKGKTQIAALLLIVLMLTLAVYLMVSSEGTHDAAILTFPGIMVLATLTLPRRIYFVFAATLILSPALVGVLEIHQVILNRFSGYTDALGVLDITVILLMTAAAVELMAGTLTESIRRARSSEARFRLLFNNSSDSIFVYGPPAPGGMPEKTLEVNDIACKRLGYSRAELGSMRPIEIYEPSDVPGVSTAMAKLGAEGAVVCESAHRTKDGRSIPVELSLQRFSLEGGEAVIANARDITERKRAQDEINSSLNEKEVLLREIHHRVKNNLQVISSLLNLQASMTEDAATKAMLEESRHRVRSMALIHESLYRARNLASIDFADYLRALTREILHTFGRSDIACNLELASVGLSVDKAIPSGLIVNELLTNALKHAFPHGRSGSIGLRLQAEESGQVRIVVHDDGAGFPRGFDLAAATTMGLTIVRTLVEQIRGTISLESKHGTTLTIAFDREG